MIRRALLLVSLAAIYIAMTRKRRNLETADEHAAEAQWANEGGANTPASI